FMCAQQINKREANMTPTTSSSPSFTSSGLMLMLMLITTMLGFGCCTDQKQVMSPKTRASMLDKVTVSLVHTWNDRTVSYCTGVFVSEKVIATANHCME